MENQAPKPKNARPTGTLSGAGAAPALSGESAPEDAAATPRKEVAPLRVVGKCREVMEPRAVKTIYGPMYVFDCIVDTSAGQARLGVFCPNADGTPAPQSRLSALLESYQVDTVPALTGRLVAVQRMLNQQYQVDLWREEEDDLLA